MATDTQIGQFAADLQAVAELEGVERKKKLLNTLQEAVKWLLPNCGEDVNSTLVELALPPAPGGKGFYEIARPLGFDLLLAGRNAIQSNTSLEPALNQAFDALFPKGADGKRSLSELVTQYIDDRAKGKPALRLTHIVVAQDVVDGLENLGKGKRGGGAAI